MFLGLDEVFDGDESGEPAVSVDDRQFSILLRRNSPSAGIGGDALLRGDERDLVMTSATRLVISTSKRISRLVMMPTREPSPSTTGRPEM